MRAAMARLVLVGLMTLLVGCDHATKFVAKSQLEGQHPRELIRGALDLQYVENTDVAFNLLRWVPEKTRAPILMVSGTLAFHVLAGLVVFRSPRVSLAGA